MHFTLSVSTTKSSFLQWLVAAQFVKNFGRVGVVAMLMFGLGNSDFAFCADS